MLTGVDHVTLRSRPQTTVGSASGSCRVGGTRPACTTPWWAGGRYYLAEDRVPAGSTHPNRVRGSAGICLAWMPCPRRAWYAAVLAPASPHDSAGESGTTRMRSAGNRVHRWLQFSHRRWRVAHGPSPCVLTLTTEKAPDAAA
jgi:hypothetical protein